MSWGSLAREIDRLRAEPPVVMSTPLEDEAAATRERLNRLTQRASLERASRTLAMQVPAYRTAHTLITKRAGTLPLALYVGDYPAPVQPTWLTRPDPARTMAELVSATLDDALWHDRAYWRITGVDPATGAPVAFRRVPATRVHEVVDPTGELLPTLYVDGKPATASLVRFTWEGMGGFSRHGGLVLGLAQQLMQTAGRYALTPLPSTALVNKGVPLDDDEIDEVIDGWEEARDEHVTAFINRAVELQTYGWSSAELQLVESREHTAVEIARATSLPAVFLDATPPKGSNMTYANVTDRRRELTEALRLWRAPIEQGLTLAATPDTGQAIRWNDTSYVRDDPKTRAETWEVFLRSGVLTVDEARRQEPLALDAGGGR